MLGQDNAGQRGHVFNGGYSAFYIPKFLFLHLSFFPVDILSIYLHMSINASHMCVHSSCLVKNCFLSHLPSDLRLIIHEE